MNVCCLLHKPVALNGRESTTLGIVCWLLMEDFSPSPAHAVTLHLWTLVMSLAQVNRGENDENSFGLSV